MKKFLLIVAMMLSATTVYAKNYGKDLTPLLSDDMTAYTYVNGKKVELEHVEPSTAQVTIAVWPLDGSEPKIYRMPRQECPVHGPREQQIFMDKDTIFCRRCYIEFLDGKRKIVERVKEGSQ